MREKKQIDYIKARAAPFSIERKKSKRKQRNDPKRKYQHDNFPHTSRMHIQDNKMP